VAEDRLAVTILERHHGDSGFFVVAITLLKVKSTALPPGKA
jgi:hypothetical protein